jgi:senataxin
MSYTVLHCFINCSHDYVDIAALLVLPLTQLLTLLTLHIVSFGTATATTVTTISVDAFQGQERDIIIFSSVRAPCNDGSSSGGIGFVSDARRLNVGATTARHAQLMVGHAKTLASYSDHWRELIADAVRRPGTLYSL